MRLTHIDIKNFRCFDKKTFDLDSHIVLIKGENGSGKSSILESLHYLCYLRSFRATSPRDLIRFDQESFFLKVNFFHNNEQSVRNELQVGFDQKKRLVKLNKKSISSFKELMDFYRIITITEDDLDLIRRGPDIRRYFVDQAIMLEKPDYSVQVRDFRKILANRNSLFFNKSNNKDFEFWTEQLWKRTRSIQLIRLDMLVKLQNSVNFMLKEIFDENIIVSIGYKPKKIDIKDSFSSFINEYQKKDILSQEQKYGRSLFGVHLDDILIKFQNKKTKSFASRGQQKLTVLLIKVAQLMLLEKHRGPAVLLLDDFMSDFDDKRIKLLVQFLASLSNQLIFTSPSSKGPFDKVIEGFEAKVIRLSN